MVTFLIAIFLVGYCAIALEHVLKINKAVSALFAGVLTWTVYIIFSADKVHVANQLIEGLGNNGGILFFLLGAMTIVEIISAHNGFDVITKIINVTSKRKLLWLMTIITFFLSAVLDNLTTTIVMISLLSRFGLSKEDKMLFAGLTVIAANGGGAWTTIGDVTTTMLWIGNRITSLGIMREVFLTSAVSTLVPLAFISFFVKGKLDVVPKAASHAAANIKSWESTSVFFLGIGSLLFVPFFKGMTGLPPFMGILFGLAVLWLYTEIIHAKKHEDSRELYSVTQALRRIDLGSVLFFLGILTCISSLEASGILSTIATSLNNSLKNPLLINFVIGLLSAIVDNVPLVYGTMGMYTLQQFPVDNAFWTFLAYCAGTGGSILVIGSAAGVVSMALAKINFIWYMKKISFPALLGYLAGAIVFVLTNGKF